MTTYEHNVSYQIGVLRAQIQLNVEDERIREKLLNQLKTVFDLYKDEAVLKDSV